MTAITAKHGNVFALVLALWAPATAALDVQLPDGLTLTFEDQRDPDTYFIPVGSWDGEKVPAVAVDGLIQRQAWRMPTQTITPLQVMSPLRDQLAKAGFSTLLDCVDVTCGGFDFNFGTETILPPDMYVNLSDYRFFSAVQENSGQFVSILVSQSANSIFLQIIQAGPSGADPAHISGSRAPEPQADTPQSLVQRLEDNGHVVLDDLIFESGSSELGGGTFQSLADLSDYLRANPNRQIVLVGHTDATGTLVGNIALSKQRASSVAQRLVADYDVSQDQISAQGVGYLAPVASNLTSEGRLRNRRVDAVLISTD
ncbi:MAG: OmpA family protein [Rhodobacteraceae bacterium]|nr:OmpA family protein [Paracoccaceae bacterium]